MVVLFSLVSLELLGLNCQESSLQGSWESTETTPRAQGILKKGGEKGELLYLQILKNWSGVLVQEETQNYFRSIHYKV